MSSNSQNVTDGQFDHIVVGGGSAGCVLAARLSEDPRTRVLLIEAGKDYSPGHEPALIRDAGARTFATFQFSWPTLMAEVATPGVNIPFSQAQVMGGGSSINGMHAQRGEAADYDEWHERGVTGWGWNDLLPYFKRLETDLDFSGPLHGDKGPIKIRRFGPEKWSPLSKAFRAAMQSQGLRYVEDVNVEGGEMVGMIPHNTTNERISSSGAYLTPEVRARANLAILAETSVRRVVFTGTRVSGVELAGPTPRIVHGANVISCAGGVHSPILLQRSGIGPAEMLLGAGIPVIADRKGVGKNLQNHPFMDVTAHLHRRARIADYSQPAALLVARFSSGHPNCPPVDLLLNMWERVPLTLTRDPMARQFSNFMLILNKAFSEGSVSVDPADPFGAVKLRTNILGDPRDRARMIEGYKRVALLTMSEHFRGLVSDSFAINYGPMVFALTAGTWRSRVMSELGALALDLPRPLRRLFLGNTMMDIAPLMHDPDALEKHVVARTHPGGHPSGTCALGDPARDTTVVDARCRVIGVDGLRVVDASIFPTLTRGGPNIPVMASAEKAADMIREDARF
jgi:5-(hydroxymethyl)furfural/furfural oxidase